MKDAVTFADFQKFTFTVGKIIDAEPVKGSEELLKLMVDIGSETRQIVAGIAKKYVPEDLKEKKIVVIANLETKVIRGEESQGMILAADDNGIPILISPIEDVPEGTQVR